MLMHGARAGASKLALTGKALLSVVEGLTANGLT